MKAFGKEEKELTQWQGLEECGSTMQTDVMAGVSGCGEPGTLNLGRRLGMLTLDMHQDEVPLKHSGGGDEQACQRGSLA